MIFMSLENRITINPYADSCLKASDRLPEQGMDGSDASIHDEMRNFLFCDSEIPSPHGKHDTGQKQHFETVSEYGTDESDELPIQSLSIVNDDMIQRLGPRLTDDVAYYNDAIALGTIRIYEQQDPTTGRSEIYLQGRHHHDVWPNILIQLGQRKKMLQLDGLSIGTRGKMTSLRVYLMPQDTDSELIISAKEHQKVVKYLLDFVDCSIEAWEGTADPMADIQTYPEPVYEGQESLFYIFNTLPSPKPDLDITGEAQWSSQAMHDVMNDEIIGVKTQLYPHQARSAALMIQKESHPALMDDPTKMRLFDLYGKEFFYDHHSGALFNNIPRYPEAQGGILAETMGYGKTLICLAVILATRGHYPSIPTSCLENEEEKLHERTPSLLAMAARQIKQKGYPWKNEFYALKRGGEHFDRCIAELKKYERSFIEPLPGVRTPARSTKREQDKKILRICSATLIIVPPNLVTQWESEITKHIDEDAIDYKVIHKSEDEIPQWTELIKYDIILMSKSRFEKEYRDDDLHTGRNLQRGTSKYKSPLTDLRWLRIIIDEGHAVAGSSKTNAVTMLEKLSVERRWVVSGTPSTTLQGVDVSLASMNSKLDSSEQRTYTNALEKSRRPRDQHVEMTDVGKLRMMVTKFLKLQPWTNKKGDDEYIDWKTYLSPRLQNGQLVSSPVLRQIMQTLIVRHQIQEIAVDLVLPTLHTKTVLIEPAYYDKLSINLFHMVLASNYITSEREDQDYMFHPRSRGKLTQLIANLGHATFYWIGFSRELVQDSIAVSEKYLTEHVDIVTDEDGALLTKAIRSGHQVLSDSGWLAISQLHEMGVCLQNFPEQSAKCWSLDSSKLDPALLGTNQARDVQRILQEHDGNTSVETLRKHGMKVMKNARERSTVKEGKKAKQEVAVANVGSMNEPTKKGVGNLSPMKSIPSIKSQSQQTQASTLTGATNITIPNPIVVGFVSAKLTYLCDRILNHPTEKTIIFYSHSNTAFFIAEALELLRISFLIYANTLSLAQRADHLAKFNTEQSFKVLLMDLKQAGHGLHVAAASRVYLVNPVWDSAIESQAIKRAHRLGQNKEVFVETLVLKNTFEEALVARRAEKAAQPSRLSQNITNDTSTKAAKTSMLDDNVMVQVLKDIKFLKADPEEPRFARLATPQPLVLETTSQTSADTTMRNNETQGNHPFDPTQELNTSSIFTIPTPHLGIKRTASTSRENRQKRVRTRPEQDASDT